MLIVVTSPKNENERTAMHRQRKTAVYIVRAFCVTQQLNIVRLFCLRVFTAPFCTVVNKKLHVIMLASAVTVRDCCVSVIWPCEFI